MNEMLTDFSTVEKKEIVKNNRVLEKVWHITEEKEFKELCQEFYKPGGIWFNGSGSLSIENSIIYGNTYSSNNDKSRPNIGEQQIKLRGSPALRIRTSDIQGLGFFSGVTGQGNIDANPDFMDSNIGNLHLNGGSPCIDTGSNFADYGPMEPGFQLLPKTDLDGYLRVVDGDNNGTAVVDMGPYENQGN